MSTRAIQALLEQAADEYADMGVVLADTQADLADEGYDLDQLEADCEAILTERPSAQVLAFPTADEYVG